MQKICLIIPCYNEENRIDVNSFLQYSEEIRFIFVNDGSTDNTVSILNRNYPTQNIIQLKNNKGKAEAVRQGILYALKHIDDNSFVWIGFWDADLSTPLSEVENFIKYSQIYEDVDAIFGSRIKRLGCKIDRDFLRHIMGRVFVTITSVLFNLGSYDSQCGAKLFRREIVENVFRNPFHSKWIFDIEIILRMKNLNIIEFPLIQWNEIKGSKLNIFRDVLKIIKDIIKLKSNY